VSYLSLKPSSSVQEEVSLPSAVAFVAGRPRQPEKRPRIRNPGSFGLISHGPVAGDQAQLAPGVGDVPLIAGALLALIVLFELLRVFVPGRRSDPADLTAGGPRELALAWCAGGEFRGGVAR